MLKVEISLYRLRELSPAAYRRAVDDHRYFLLDALQPDYIDGVTDWNDPGKMEMYRAEYDYIMFNDNPVIDSINCNGYFFHPDGEICWTCTYTAGPKKGLTEIKIHGEAYTVKGRDTV